MPIPKSAGAAIDETRQAWRDFVELFAVEGRLASLSLVRLIVFALLGGILLIISWLLLCVSLVDALHTAYAWEWKYVIAALAGSHLFAACLMLFSLRKIASRFFFPSTLAEIRGTKGSESAPSIDIAQLERERKAIEVSLARAKYGAAQAARQTERDFKVWVTKPSVLASAVAIGFFLAQRRSKNAEPIGFRGFLLPIVLNQLARTSIGHIASSWNARRSIRSDIVESESLR